MISWTDDLPVCHLSGVGFSTNQIYREDGKRQEDHEFEDRSFHFRLNDNCFLYGVFDGHNGSNASNFAAQRLPAELFFDNIVDKTNSDIIKHTLSQAFLAVEKSFFESMDKALAQRATLILSLPEGESAYDTRHPDISVKLQLLDAQIAGGTTALIALVLNDNLYVANVGDTRALIVKVDESGVLKVSQISDDHTISNEEELDRLRDLGLNVDMLRQQRRIGTSDNTRCIGDYHVKGGRGDIDYLRDARGDPVIAEPSIYGPIPIDESCLFLMVMSDGLYHAVQDSTGHDMVNSDIASMVAEEFTNQSTLNGVAQAVVDRVVRRHNDTYFIGLREGQQICQKCGDITLLVRQFSCPLPKAIGTTTSAGLYPVSVPFYTARSPQKHSVKIPTTNPHDIVFQRTASVQRTASGENTPTELSQPLTPTNSMEQFQSVSTQSTVSTESTQGSGDTRLFSRKKYERKLELDGDGRIEAYVDFSAFYDALNQMPESHRNQVLEELMPRSDCERILEVNTPTDDHELCNGIGGESNL